MRFDFSIARLPRIEFGEGVIRKLPTLARQFGKTVLVVTGRKSFIESEHWASLQKAMTGQGLTVYQCQVSGEPSPEQVNSQVDAFAGKDIDVVVAIGGGSALDAGKAIAGLLRVGRSVTDYLEGVGVELPYEGPAVPLIAVPTTAGTGSEATKNAVLSVHGKDGFKKSFRDDKLVAEYAVLDPQLLASCPPTLIAANGMDALTQLMESYVSIKANPFTDALAISGLLEVRDSLLAWYEQPADSASYRGKMAYAALLSGITLAQCGLGSVHGLASPLGAFYPIPHGVVCGTLVAEATAVNIQAMRERQPDNPALERYARVAEALCGRSFSNHELAWTALVDLLHDWTGRMQLARLSEFGVKENELDHVVRHCRGSSMKTNPIVLSDVEIKAILQNRL